MSLRCQHLLASCVLLLFAISVRVTCRRYNNGLVFYDLRTHMVYLPPTVSAARGRSLGSVKYSAMGSIWSTFGQPCECSGVVCGCCVGLKIEQYKFDQRICANVTFVPARAEALLEVFLNEQSSAKYGVSVRNPTPFCIPVMMGVPMAMCVQMSNVQLVGNNLNMCMDFVVRLASTELFEMHFQCMRMGLDGVQYVDKNGQPVLPSSTAIKSDAIDEYVNDEDAAASEEYYDELEKQQAADGIASQLEQTIHNAPTYEDEDEDEDEAEEVTNEITTTKEDMSYVTNVTVEKVNEAEAEVEAEAEGEDDADYNTIHEIETNKDSMTEGQVQFEMPSTQMSNVEIESEMLSLANNIDSGNVIANEPSDAVFTTEANTGSLSSDNDNDNHSNYNNSNNSNSHNNYYNIDFDIGESELKQNELIEAITVAKTETTSAATACSTTNAADSTQSFDLSEKECDNNEILNNNDNSKLDVEYENDDDDDDDGHDDNAEVENEGEEEEATEEDNNTTATGEEGEANVFVADVVEEGSAAIDQEVTSATATSGDNDEFDNNDESVTSSDNYDLSDSSHHSNTGNNYNNNNNNNNEKKRCNNSSISSNYIENERNNNNDVVANGNDITNGHEHEQWHEHEHEYAHKYDERDETLSAAYSDSKANANDDDDDDDDDGIDGAAIDDEFIAAATANKNVVTDDGDADGDAVVDGGGGDADTVNDVTAGSVAEMLSAIKFYRHLHRF